MEFHLEDSVDTGRYYPAFDTPDFDFDWNDIDDALDGGEDVWAVVGNNGISIDDFIGLEFPDESQNTIDLYNTRSEQAPAQ